MKFPHCPRLNIYCQFFLTLFACQFIQESCTMGAVEIHWMSEKDNASVILTNNLSAPIFHKYQAILICDYEPITSKRDHDTNYIRKRDN